MAVLRNGFQNFFYGMYLLHYGHIIFSCVNTESCTRGRFSVVRGFIPIGYSISCISNSTCAAVSALLGDTPLPSLELSDPLPNAVNSILRTGRTLAEHWKMLAMFGEGVNCTCTHVCDMNTCTC